MEIHEKTCFALILAKNIQCLGSNMVLQGPLDIYLKVGK